MDFGFLFLFVLPSLAIAAPEVVENGRQCPNAASPDYDPFPYSQQVSTNQFRSSLLSISVVEQNGTVRTEYNTNAPFSFISAPKPQYVFGFTVPIKINGEIAKELAQIVSGRDSPFLNEKFRIFYVDDCSAKNDSTLPNIVLKFGDSQKSVDRILTSSDYIIQHPTRGYCYFAFHYFTDGNLLVTDTDFIAHNFCVALDLEAKTAAFARPLA